MEAGRRAGRAVIGNYRVVAHGGSRERSRERANKNASTLASGVPASFRRRIYRDNRGFARDNPEQSVLISASAWKSRENRKKNPCWCRRKRSIDPILHGLSSVLPHHCGWEKQIRMGLGAIGERRPADFSRLTRTFSLFIPDDKRACKSISMLMNARGGLTFEVFIASRKRARGVDLKYCWVPLVMGCMDIIVNISK